MLSFLFFFILLIFPSLNSTLKGSVGDIYKKEKIKFNLITIDNLKPTLEVKKIQESFTNLMHAYITKKIFEELKKKLQNNESFDRLNEHELKLIQYYVNEPINISNKNDRAKIIKILSSFERDFYKKQCVENIENKNLNILNLIADFSNLKTEQTVPSILGEKDKNDKKLKEIHAQAMIRGSYCLLDSESFNFGLAIKAGGQYLNSNFNAFIASGILFQFNPFLEHFEYFRLELLGNFKIALAQELPSYSGFTANTFVNFLNSRFKAGISFYYSAEKIIFLGMILGADIVQAESYDLGLDILINYDFA